MLRDGISAAPTATHSAASVTRGQKIPAIARPTIEAKPILSAIFLNRVEINAASQTAEA
jgi:hypothetical protein